ncbi:MAG: hypothetical protein IKG40_00460 [Bacilli bacterium]|nr:hypothetical protein [Bacilli bacterium]
MILAVKYNTNDLMLGKYKYNYVVGKTSVSGQRMGVLVYNDGLYEDLISGENVRDEDIIMKKMFNARDNIISLDSVQRIFKEIEDICEYMATEKQEGIIDESMPTVITFKASEMNHALESMFKDKKTVKVKKILRFKK